jgi:hypothetical protein
MATIPLITGPILDSVGAINTLTNNTNASVIAAQAAAQAASTPSGGGAATAVSGAATLNTQNGVVTSEALSTATTYTLTLTNSLIKSTSAFICSPYDGATTGVQITSITLTTSTAVVVMAMASLTGTIKVPFAVFN